MQEIFYELIKECKDGKVIIDGEIWPIGFDTIIGNEKFISDNNLSLLEINDELNFFKLLQDYVDLVLIKYKPISYFKNNDYIKLIIAYLFVNATTEDFKSPLEYIKRRIKFLQDNTFSYLDEQLELDMTGGYLTIVI